MLSEDLDTESEKHEAPTELMVKCFTHMQALFLRATRSEEAWLAETQWAIEGCTPSAIIKPTREEMLLAENAICKGL